jgi:hypothetical protein
MVTGSISLPGGYFQIRPGDRGNHIITEVDQSELEPDADPIAPSIDNKSEMSPLEISPYTYDYMTDDGSEIDVLVVYTASARNAAGGASAINNLIDLAITEANVSYLNSGIDHRLRLIKTQEVSYTESGNPSTDLGRLKNTTDGYMDIVHTIRNDVAADIVVLIVNDAGSYCGMAYIMTSVSPSFAGSAFAVVADHCLSGNYSLAHEIGHINSARHDWYVDSTDNSPFTYNHGYINLTNRFRTIMAYDDECAANGFYCTRIPYWSNPDVLYSGVNTGIPEGEYHPSNNRKTLNNTSQVSSNFMPSCCQKITADDAKANDYFGGSVSLSGNRVAIGSTGSDGLDSDCGAVYIFEYNNKTWEKAAKISPALGDSRPSLGFGYSVSLEGDTLITGTAGQYPWAFVYRFNGTNWVKETILSPSNMEIYSLFGTAISINGDRVIIGAEQENDSGAVYIFHFDGGQWKEEARLVSSDLSVGDCFGSSVSIENDRAVVGAPYKGDYLWGAIYIFKHDGFNWVQEKKIVPNDSSAGDQFGRSVSILNNKILVGAPGRTNATGVAYVYRHETDWIEEQKLTSSDGQVSDYFGYSVALDFNRAVVGAMADDSSGSAYFFQYHNGSWNEDAKLKKSNSGDNFGRSVSLNGEKVVVSCQYSDTSLQNTGSVSSFNLKNIVCIGDMDGDFDIDGSDLAQLILSQQSSLEQVATNFGRNCY